MIDRIKIKTNIKNLKNCNEVKDNIKRLGKFINGDLNKFSAKYLIVNKLFRLEFYPISCSVIIDFNIVRAINGVNLREVENEDVKSFIHSLNNFLENKLGLRTNILSWNIKSVEVKKDIKYGNELMAQNVIDTYKKCSKANMKTLDFNTSYYRYNKSVKVCCYRKDIEIQDKGCWEKLTKGQKEEVRNTVRFEVELTGKKLCSILKTKRIDLGDILNPVLQAIIHKNLFKTLGFTNKLLSKREVERRVKALPFQKRKIYKIWDMVKALNKCSFKEVKNKFSSIYKYLKILGEYSICPYWVDINVLEIINKKKNDKLDFFRYVNLLKNNPDIYNIWVLIYYIKNINLKLRI